MASNYFKTKKRMADIVNLRKRAGKSLSYKVLSTLAMTGFALAPWSAQDASAEIVRDNGTAFNGPVNNIYAEKVQGDNAVNRFQKFELPANQIANMYFRENPSSADAKNLFNFVNSQINIAGTVNAVQNSRVGGNLYFFSKEGMVVSSTGVINAGSLTAMSGVKYPKSMDEAFKAVGNIQNMKYSDVLASGNTGEIKLEGTINAVDFVSLKSDYKLNVGATGKINTNSSVDFAKYVNIGSGASKVDSGLNTSNLVLQRQAGNGNIVLMSEANDYNDKAPAIEGWMSTATKNNVVAKVELAKGSQINTDGQVSISASAVNASGFGNLATFGIIGQTTAEVNLNGTINADKITASTNSDNSYVQNLPSKIVRSLEKIATESILAQIITDGSPLIAAVDVQALKAQSDIKIGSDAKLTANGIDTRKDGKLTTGALNLTANSSVKEVAANTADSSSTGNKSAAISIVYSYYDSNANVDIATGAQLKTTNAKGSVNVASNASSDIDTGANVAKQRSLTTESSKANFAFNIVRGVTNSTISLSQGASIDSGMDAVLKADVSEKLNARAANVANQNTALNTSALYTDVDSEAKIDVKGSIEANNNVELNAENKDNLFNKVTNAESKLGEGSWISLLAEPSGGDFAGPIYNIVLSRLTMDFDPLDSKWDKFKKFVAGPDGPTDFKAGKIVAGASVGISRTSNKANINVANTATLNAKNGDLKLNAKQYYDDYRLYVTGSANGEHDKLVSVAIGIGTQNDEANINVAGGTAAKHAVLKAEKGNVKLNAESDYTWNRLEKMKGALKKALDAITFADIRKAKEAGAKVPADIEDYVNAPTAEKYAAIEKKIQNDPGAISWISGGVSAIFGLGQLWRAADSFANATSYTNVNVGTTARPKVSGQSGDGKAAIAASAGYTNFKHNANIIIGKQTELTAGKDIDLKAIAKQLDVNYYGAVQGLGGTIFEGEKWAKYVFNKLELDAKILPSWSRSDGDVYGGNVGITDNTLNSRVIVAEGAKLEANQVALAADTDLKRVLVTLGGGSAGDTGATGMFSYHTGVTNSIVSLDDESNVVAKGTKGLALNADNDSFLLSVNGDVTASSAQAVGAAGGFVHNDVNTIAGIHDNDKETINKTDDNDKDMHKAIKVGLSDDQLGYLGSTGNKLTTNSFTLSKLSAQAISSPTIISVSAAGAVSKKPKLNDNPVGGGNDINGFQELIDEEDINNGALNEAAEGNHNDEIEAQNPLNEGGRAFTNIVGAGAVEINKYSGVTAALLEGATVNYTNGERALDLYAYDNAMAVTVSGALALKLGAKPGATSTVMVAGTSAVNDIGLTALSRIKNSTIKDAVSVTNEAKQEEMIVAAAAPVNVDASGGDEGNTGFSTAINASVNLVDNHAKAIMEKNSVEMYSFAPANTAGIQNIADNTSTQVTGGLSVDVAKTTGLGINVVVGSLKNEVLAEVMGGSYLYANGFENIAAANMTQINAALGIGAGRGSDSASATFGALVSVSKTKDDIKASVDGATIAADSLTNKAFDGEVKTNKVTDETWTENENRKAMIKSLGLDVDGSELKDNVANGTTDVDLNTDNVDANVDDSKKYEAGAKLDDGAGEKDVYDRKKLTFAANKKTLVVNAGLLISAGLSDKSKATVAAAVVDAMVDNDYVAEIKDAHVIAANHTKGVTNQAYNKNQLISVTGGISFAPTTESVFSGAGSAAVTVQDNDTIAVIADSKVEADAINLKAENDSSAIAVAGNINFSNSKGGIGLSVAVNKLDNNTEAKALGATLQGFNSGSTNVVLDALNTANVKAIGAGIGFEGADAIVGAQGNVAVNYGHNDTIAEVDQTYNIDEKTKQKTLKNSSKIINTAGLKVDATDNTTMTAVAANLNVTGGTVALGCSTAVNKLNEQQLLASVKNTDITTAKGAKLEVATDETMKLSTIAAGGNVTAGADNKVAFNGTMAITLTDGKENTAEVVNSNIKGYKAGEEAADLTIKAREANKIVATSDSVSVAVGSKGVFSLGAAGSGIKLGSTTTARLEKSVVNADDVEVNAYGEEKVYHVVAGVNVGSSTVNTAGSVGVNLLKDDVKAIVEGATINAKGSVGVVARAEDTLVNVVGGLHVGVNSTVGIGVAVGYNTMSGDVDATVNNSTIKALGNTDKTVVAHEYNTNSENAMTLATNKHKGLVVDASTNYDVTDVVVNGGVTLNLGAEAIAVDLNGLGANTDITGSTKAHLTNSNVNKTLAKDETNNGDVAVTAYDDATIHDVAVNVSAAIGKEASLAAGMAVSMSDINRTTEALTSDGVINAKKLIDTAGAKAYDHMVLVGVTGGVAFSEGLGAGIGGAALTMESTSKVKANIKNVTSTNEGLVLKAAHDNYLDYSAVGVTFGISGFIGGAVGITGAVIRENNTINGSLDNVHITHTGKNAEDVLAVTSYSKARPTLANVVVSGGQAGASVGIAVDSHSIEDELKLDVLNSELKNAKNIDAKVDNAYDIKENSVNVALAVSLGAGIGISVQPVTINSTELMNIKNSTFNATNDVNINVNELRKIDMNNVNVAVSTIVGVGVTNSDITLGGKLVDVRNPEGASGDFSVNNGKYIGYTEDSAARGKGLIKDALNKSQVKASEDKLKDKKEDGSASTPIKDSINKEEAKLNSKTIKINLGKEQVQGAAVEMGNATINAANNVLISSTIKDDIDLYAATGSVGVVAVAVNSAHVTEEVANRIEIIGGSIKGKNLAILAKTEGEAKSKARIASVGLASVNVGYATTEVSGDGNVVHINGGNLTSSNSTLIRSLHDTVYSAQTDCFGVSFVSGGYQEAEVKDKLNSDVSVENSVLTNTAKNYDTEKGSAKTNTADWKSQWASNGAIEVASIKASTADASSSYGGSSLLVGNGNTNKSTIDGKSTVKFNDNKVNDIGAGKNTVDGGVLELYSRYAAKATTDMTFISVGIAASGGGVSAKAMNTGVASVDASGNTLDVASFKTNSLVQGTDKDNLLAKTAVEAVNVSVGVGAGNNNGTAEIGTSSNVALKDNKFTTRKVTSTTIIDHYDPFTAKDSEGREYTDYKPVYQTVEVGRTAVEANAVTNAKADTDIMGVTVGGVIAVGHNKGIVTVNENTDVTMDNSGLKDKDNKVQKTILKSLALNTNGTNVMSNVTDGRGGGIVSISPYAATAHNTSTIINKATLSGNYKIDDALKVSALQTDMVAIHGITESGGVVDVAGAEITNVRTKESVTQVSLDNAQVEADSASITAKNVMSLNKPGAFYVDGGDHDDQYGLRGGSGGVLSHSAPLRFTNTLDEAANITIGTGSSVTTDKKLALEAATDNSIYVKSRFVSGGLTTSNQVYAINNLTYSDTVNIDGTLKTNTNAGDITIDSVDNTNLQVGAYSTARGGLGAGSLPETDNTTSRTNKVTVNEHGSVYSSNNLNVNAGQYSGITMAGLNAVIDVQAFSAALIPHNGNVLKNKIIENNIVTVDTGASLKSIADTSIYANEGATKIDISNISTNGYGQDWTEKKGYIASEEKPGNPGDVSLTGNNRVIINGSVEAGIKDKINITIGSKDGDVVILDDNKRKLFNSSGNSKTAKGREGIVTVEGDDAQESIKKAITYKTINLVSELYQQYEKQQKVVQDYSNNKTSEAYAVALAKLAALENQLKEMGFAVDAKGEGQSGKIETAINSSVTVDAIILPSLYVSGGDVKINSANLQGAGSITAKGSPVANITNNTTLYMVLNDVQVGEAGGNVTYNKTALQSGDGADVLAANKETIKSLNADKNSEVNFQKLSTQSGKNGSIDIESTYTTPDTFTIKQKDGDKTVTDTVKVINNIELANGHSIINKNGDITIHSLHGDLLLNGTVSGKNNYIKADHGSLYQNTLKGLWTVGGDVEQQYKDLFTSYVKDEDKYLTGGDDHKTGVAKSDKAIYSDDAAGNIMGSSIFIAADTVNINGLVQSGYEEYKVNVGEADKAAIDKLNKTYGSSSFADDDILNMGVNSEFCVVKGGQVYNAEKGYYYYQAPVFYNPTTKKLLVGKIEDYGGTIYITGKIASTGNGRIVAMDGTYDINAVNDTNYDLKLYGLSSTTAEGKITIVDTQKKQQTEITRNSYTITNLTTGDTKTTAGAMDSYAPDKDLRYSWSAGKDKAVRVYKEHKLEQSWWGAYDSKDDIYNKGQQTKTTDLDFKAKENDGTGLSKLSGHSSNFEISFDRVQTSTSKSDITETRWTTGLYGFRKHQLYQWYEDSGYSYTYTASVDASKNIGIKFIGNENGYSNINVKSGGSIDVHGDIGNTSLKSTVSINSVNGGIYQDRGSIKGDKVVLNSVGAMNGINILGTNQLMLTATNNATANTTYWRNGVSTKTNNGNNINIYAETEQLVKDGITDFGTVNLVGKNGSVSGDTKLVGQFNLTASGNIVQGDAKPSAVTASKVTLTAVNGAIGTAAKALLVNVGETPINSKDTLSASLNAAAKGNIYLEEESGDLRIGTIYSDEGDVSLTGPGNLVDALPYTKTNDSRSEAELTDMWKSLGLLDDATHENYTTTKTDKPALDKEINYITTDDKGNKHYFIRTIGSVDEKGVPTFNDQEIPYADLIIEAASGDKQARYFTQKKDSNGKLLYVESKVSKGQDVNRLLYTVSTAIINPKSGTVLPEKVANIKAKNLTLNMGNSAGLNSDKITEYKISELGFKYSDFRDLKDIARADAVNVTWDEKNDKVTIRERLPIGVKLSGNLYVNAGQKDGKNNADAGIDGNVYIEQRNLLDEVVSTNNNDINIGMIKAKGDILLKNAFGSVLNGSGVNNIAIINGANLIFSVGGINSGAGSLGVYGNALPVNISGYVRGTAVAGIYLNQVTANDLKLQNMSTKGDIYLTALGNIVSDTSLNEKSYLAVEENGHVISLESKQGNVGTEKNWLRVVNGDTIDDSDAAAEAEITTAKGLVVKAAKDAYIRGMTKDDDEELASGTLFIKDITVGDTNSINLDVNGSIFFKNAKANSINAKAAMNIMEQSEHSVIVADKLVAEAETGISLRGVNNKLHNVELYNADKYDGFGTGSTLVNSGSQDLNIVAVGNRKADAQNKFAGSLTVTNVSKEAENDVLLTGKALVDGEFKVENLEADVYIPGKEAAQETAVGEVVIDADSVILSAEGKIVNAKGIKAQNGITMSGKGLEAPVTEGILNDKYVGVYNMGSLYTEKGNITLKSEQGAVWNGMLYGSVEPEDNRTTIAGAGNIKLEAAGDVINKQSLTVIGKGDIDLISNTNGSVYSLGEDRLFAKAGDINIMAKAIQVGAYYGTQSIYDNKEAMESLLNLDYDDMATVAKLKVVGSVFNVATAVADGMRLNIISEHGNVFNYNDFSSNNDSLDYSASNMLLSAAKGSLYNDIDLHSGGHINLIAQEGLDSFSYNIYGKQGITLNATKGDINNKAILEAENGNIQLLADNGSITNMSGADIITAGGNVELHAKGNVVNYGNTLADFNPDVKESGNVILKSDEGNVSNFFDFRETSGSNSKYYSQAGQKYYKLGEKDIMVAANDLTLSAVKGTVFNSKQLLEAKRDVTLEARDGMSNFAYDVHAGRNITLTATDGLLVNNAKLVADSGIVKLEAKNGSVVNMLHGDIVAQEGSVAMLAGAEHKDALQLVHTVIDAKGNVTSKVVGISNIVADGPVVDNAITSIKNGDGSVPTTGNDTILVDKYYNDGSGYVRVDENTDLLALTADQKDSLITVFYKVDDAKNKKTLVTSFDTELEKASFTLGDVKYSGVKGDAEAFRQGDIVNRGNIVAGGGTAAFKSEYGNIINYDNFEKFNGQDNQAGLNAVGIGAPKAIKATYGVSFAAAGKFYNNMNIESGRDLTISSGADIVSGQDYNHLYAVGKLTIESTGGSINNGAELIAGNGVVLRAYKGLINTNDITTGGVIELLAGGIDNHGGLNADIANLYNSGDLTAGSHVRVETNIGAVTLENVDITAKNKAGAVAGEELGYINIKTTKGDISIANAADANGVAHNYTLNHKADDAITITSDAGSIISLRTNLEAGKDINLNAGGTGSITSTGNMQAGSYAADVAHFGFIKNDYDNHSGKVNLTAETSINHTGSVMAADAVAMKAKTGKIEYMGSIVAGDTVLVDAKGYIGLKASVRAQNAITIGEVKDEKAVASSVSVGQGDIANINGDIKLQGNKGVSFTEGNIDAKAGSVLLKSYEKGDARLVEAVVNAAKDVELLANEGDVKFIHVSDISKNELAINARGKVDLKTNQGDVVTEQSTIAAYGNVVLATAKGDIVNEAGITSKGYIDIKSEGGFTEVIGGYTFEHNGTVDNFGKLTAKSDNAENDNHVAITGYSSAYNCGYINADDNVTITSSNGYVGNEADIYSNGSVTLNATKMGVSNFTSAISAKYDITFSAGASVNNRAASLTSAQGNVLLESTNQGSVTNKNGDITATNGNITLKAKEGDIFNIEKFHSLKALGNVELVTSKGNITNELDITSAEGHVKLNTASGTVKNTGVIAAKGEGSAEAYVELRGTDNVENTNVINAKGQVDLVSTKDGKVTNEAAITSTAGAVNLVGNGDVDNKAVIVAKESITMGSTTVTTVLKSGNPTGGLKAANVENTAGLTSSNGDISLIANNNVTNTGADLQAHNNVALKSMIKGDVVNDDSRINATNGSIALAAKEGDVKNIVAYSHEFSYEVNGVKHIISSDQVGSIENINGFLYFMDETGVARLVEVTSEISLQAKQAVNLTTDKGSIRNEGSANSTDGAITLQTASGDVANSGFLTAQHDVTVKGTDNVTNLLANIESKAGKVSLETTNEGLLSNIQSDIKAAEDISLRANRGKVVNNSSDIIAKNGNVIMQAVEYGDVNNINSDISAGYGDNASVAADKNIIITAKNGNVDNMGSDLKTTGNVELKVIVAGNVNNINSAVKAGDSVELSTAQGNLANVNSGITAGQSIATGSVKLQASGDILNVDSNITAKGNVTIASTDVGDITNDKSAIVTESGKVELKAHEGKLTNLNSNIEVKTEGDVELSATRDIYNRNGSIATANGNVDVTSTSGAHGDIYLINSNIEAGKDKSGTKATIKAENGSVVLVNSGILAGSIINVNSTNGDVVGVSYGDVVIDTQFGSSFAEQHGGITITADENVALTSVSGNIVNFGAITAKTENAGLTAYDGYVVNYANISAEKGQVNMMAYNFSDEAMNEAIISDTNPTAAKKGDVRSLNATYGNEGVHNTEITAGTGVNIYADSYIQNESNVETANGNIDIISVNSSVTLGEAATGVTPAKYHIEGEGNVNVTAKKDITNKTSVKIGSIATTEGSDGTKGKITGGSGSGNINIISQTGDIENIAGAEFVTAHGNVTMIADQNITNAGEAFARGGEIYLEAVQGNLNNTDDFDDYKGAITDMATSDITLLAAEGSLLNKHNLVSGGNVTMVAKDGLANLPAYITAVGDVTLTATDGNIVNQTAILSQNGSIKMNALKGSITNKAGAAVSNVKVYDAATDDFVERTVDMQQGDLFALGGDVILHAGGDAPNGDVINEGSIVALGSHKVNNSGTIENIAFEGSDNGTLGKRFFDAGSVTMLSDHGNVVNSDRDYNAAGTRKLQSLAIGSNSYTLALGDIALQATEGSVTNNFNIQAGGNFTAIAKDNVVFGSEKSGLTNGKNTFVITSVGGDLGITSITGKVDTKDFDMTANGNILVEGYEGVVINSDIKSVLGSVLIASAKGNIYSETYPDKAYNVDALLGTVALGVGTQATGDKEINLKVDHVSGNNVVLYAPQGNIDANKISAVNNVVTEGKGVRIGELENLNADKPVTQAIHAEHYNANYKGDVHFSYFNVGDGNVKVGGKAAFDLLRVERDLHIDAMGYTVGIYGKSAKPYHDNSAAIFYDPGLGSGSMDRPIVDMSDLFNFNGPHDITTFKERFNHIAYIMADFDSRIAEMEKGGTWHKDTKGWMNLYIDSPDYLRSNGTLLHLKHGYGVADQRYALDTLSTIVTKHNSMDLFDYYYNNPLQRNYWRTYLLEDEEDEEKQAKKAEGEVSVTEANLELKEDASGNIELKPAEQKL